MSLAFSDKQNIDCHHALLPTEENRSSIFDEYCFYREPLPRTFPLDNSNIYVILSSLVLQCKFTSLQNFQPIRIKYFDKEIQKSQKLPCPNIHKYN
jgi:hypothetical protein